MPRGDAFETGKVRIFRGSRGRAVGRLGRRAGQPGRIALPLRRRCSRARLTEGEKRCPGRKVGGTAMSEQDFAAVLERARRGDDEAMTRLVAEYEPQIRRVAHSRLSSALRAAVDSMDLVQS